MTLSYTLNVGLHTGAAAEINEITAAALAEGLLVHEFETQGDTLVLTVQTHNVHTSVFARVFHLCKTLGRHAIAVFDPYQEDGYVVGERSARYGDYDPAQFKFLSAAPV